MNYFTSIFRPMPQLNAARTPLTGAELMRVYQDGDERYVPASDVASGVPGGVPAPTVGTALNFIRINGAGSAYETQTPAQVTTDITFLQVGSGAVARPVQSRMRDWVSAADFPIVGNGTTVDTVAFQAALDSLGSAGGTVYLPPTFKIVVGNITVPPNVRILGGLAGLDASADNITFNFQDLGSAIYTQAGTTITLEAGATIERCLLSPTSIKGAQQADTSAFAGTALTVAGQGVAIINNLILGYAQGISSIGYSRVRIEWNAFDCQADVDLQQSFDTTRIVNNQCQVYLTLTAFWNSGPDPASRDKTLLYRSGTSFRLYNGSDDTQADGNLSYGRLVGWELQELNSVNFGRNWVDHPLGMNRANNKGLWFRNNVADVQAQTFLVYGVKTGVVFDGNATEQVNIDMLHAEFIDDDAVIISGGDVFINHLEAETCGARAVSISSNSSDVDLPHCRFVSITGPEPISLTVAGCSSDRVRIGSVYWDGADGSSLIGTNPLLFKSVPSADPLALPVNGSVFRVSGTTDFGNMSGAWGAREITLIFDDALTVFDGGNMNLAGNFVTSAEDSLRLIYDGSSGTWIELSRSAN